MTAPRPCRTLAPAATALAAIAVLAGCTSAPAIGPTPGSTLINAPSPELSTPPAQGLKIEINIDQKTVSPLQKEYQVEQGRTVVLVTRSDHDTSLTVTGPGINQTTFIDRRTTIPTSFVADTPGVVLIESTDPVATIARLEVG